jgi:DNA-binding SARP family transcriptional activator
VPGADDGVSGLLSLPGVPSDDPCLILAEARLFTRRGRLVEAIAAYRRAEDLLDDPDFRRGCVAERQSAALWLAGQPPPVDRIPIGISAVSAELRSLTRTPTAEVTGVLPRALQLIISGELDGAVAVLAEPPSGGGWQPLAVRLAQHWIDLARGAEEHQAGEVEATLLEAEFDGWPWLARLAQGLQTGMLLASGAWEWRCASAMELLDTLRRQHDPWTECLTALAIGVGLAHSGAADLATSAFARASSLADDLFAPSLRLWAERLSLGTTRTQQPSPHPAALHPSPTGSKAIVLTCLGGFSLTVDGTAVDWLTLRPRARSLLMLLSLHHARPMHREHLIESLWPRSELASGIRCLQVAASSIRQCLSAAGLSKDALAREGDSYVLRLDGALDQLRSFERLVADAEAATGDSALRLRSAALALYPGDLLPEAGPAEWVVEERDRLRRTAAAVAKAAAVDALTSEGPRSALEYARRSVALDQYQDLSWDLVIECHTQLGDHAAAAVARRDQARAWADLGLPL